jgi:hypothetical protein
MKKMVKEIVSEEDLWNKLTIEKLEDKKEYSAIVVTPTGCDHHPSGSGCQFLAGGGNKSSPVHQHMPVFVPC